MQIPVYIFAGFLDSGKTSLIMDTFKDESFMQKISNTLPVSYTHLTLPTKRIV